MNAVINIKNEVRRGKTTIKIVVQTFPMVIISLLSRGTIGLFFELALLEDWVAKFPVRVVIWFY